MTAETQMVHRVIIIKSVTIEIYFAITTMDLLNSMNYMSEQSHQNYFTI